MEVEEEVHRGDEDNNSSEVAKKGGERESGREAREVKRKMTQESLKGACGAILSFFPCIRIYIFCLSYMSFGSFFTPTGGVQSPDDRSPRNLTDAATPRR